MRAGPAVRGRRPLVEDVRLGAGGLAAADRLVEDVALVPALEDAFLELRERLAGVNWLVAGHGPRCYETAARRGREFAAGPRWGSRPARAPCGSPSPASSRGTRRAARASRSGGRCRRA